MANAQLAAKAERLRVLQGLHLGIPNHWYPILSSADLGEQPRAVKRFGEELVVWRDQSGQPHIFEDRCPHRGARLSTGNREKGKIQGDTFTCWYHGWSFHGDGRCAEMPAEPAGTHLKARVCIKSYHCEERAGHIWMFYGQGEVRPLDVPSELEDASWCGFRHAVIWHTNWLNILDNLSDPMHQYTLHGKSYITKRRPPFNRVRVAEEHQDRLRVVQYLEGGTGEVLTEEKFGFELQLPGRLRVDLLNAAPGGDVRVVMTMTPIDEGNSYVTYWRGRQVSGWEGLRWKAIWYLFYRRTALRVADQDESMLSTLGSLAETRLREHLGVSDRGLIRWRAMLNRAFAQNSKTPDDDAHVAAGDQEPTAGRDS